MTDPITRLDNDNNDNHNYNDNHHSSSNNKSSVVAPWCTVLACGYRQVYIAKSQLTFAAWLVQLPRTVVVDVGGHDKDETSVAATTTTTRWVWRSKRDFLRLARAFSVPFPKATFAKLSQRAPWKRPLDDNRLDQYCDPYSTNDHKKRKRNDTDDTNDSKNNDNNNWHVSMQKSVRQIDSFLQQMEKQVARIPSKNNSDDQSQFDQSQLVKAWTEFCRDHDCDNLLPSFQSPQPVNSPGNDAAARGNALGQYFCHPQVATQLVDCCLERVPFSGKSSATVFLEPSCGHGQVVQQLHKTLTNNHNATTNVDTNNPNYNIQMVGLDKDPVALAQCQQNLSSLLPGEEDDDKLGEHGSATSSDKKNDNDHPISISYVETDFLQSRRSHVLPQYDKARVVVLGGPPYSAGAGNSGDMQLDLPVRFVQHAINEYQAAVICFLMPQRCAKLDHSAWLPLDYDYQTVPLAHGSTFYFQGHSDQAVTQPSVIQCFWRKSTATEKE